MGCPFQWTRSSCMMGRLSPAAAFSAAMKNGRAFILGALRCVMTSTTPGAASASRVSSDVTRPLGIVL